MNSVYAELNILLQSGNGGYLERVTSFQRFLDNQLSQTIATHPRSVRLVTTNCESCSAGGRTDNGQRVDFSKFREHYFSSGSLALMRS